MLGSCVVLLGCFVCMFFFLLCCCVLLGRCGSSSAQLSHSIGPVWSSCSLRNLTKSTKWNLTKTPLQTKIIMKKTSKTGTLTISPAPLPPISTCPRSSSSVTFSPWNELSEPKTKKRGQIMAEDHGGTKKNWHGDTYPCSLSPDAFFPGTLSSKFSLSFSFPAYKILMYPSPPPRSWCTCCMYAGNYIHDEGIIGTQVWNLPKKILRSKNKKSWDKKSSFLFRKTVQIPGNVSTKHNYALNIPEYGATKFSGNNQVWTTKKEVRKKGQTFHM